MRYPKTIGKFKYDDVGDDMEISYSYYCAPTDSHYNISIWEYKKDDCVVFCSRSFCDPMCQDDKEKRFYPGSKMLIRDIIKTAILDYFQDNRLLAEV